MKIILLVVAIIALFFVLKNFTAIEKVSASSMGKEIEKNTIIMLWGILLVFCMLFIPYQIWSLTGSLTDWNGVFIIGASLIGTVIISYTLYFKLRLRVK
ncbi:hypothetical protein [Bacillus sp. AK128]